MTTTTIPPGVEEQAKEVLDAFNWNTWHLDWSTWGWIGWVLFFVVWETITLMAGKNQELTEHLRPLFLFSPVLWFMGVGAWMWLGVHLLWPAAEAWIQVHVGRF